MTTRSTPGVTAVCSRRATAEVRIAAKPSRAPLTPRDWDLLSSPLLARLLEGPKLWISAPFRPDLPCAKQLALRTAVAPLFIRLRQLGDSTSAEVTPHARPALTTHYCKFHFGMELRLPD